MSADNLTCMVQSDNLNVRLDAELRAALERIRDRDGPDVSLADVARRALREFVARELRDSQEAPRRDGDVAQ